MEKYYISDKLINNFGYEYVTDFGDFGIYVKKNNGKCNQFYDVLINYYENVGKPSENILIEKNAFTSIEQTLQEIDADETYREDLHEYVNELLGL